MKDMNLFDVFFWGWYQILDKTVYSLRNEVGGIGAKEHSFFVVFLIHGINLWTFLSYFVAKHFHVGIPLYTSISIAIIVFGIGYLIYFRRGRATKIIMSNVKTAKGILFVILSLAYIILSAYAMLEVGNYVRLRLVP
ncbi:MAG: hypothetical protein ACKVOQ_23135 [Cyclobacteriaceae bacterium]